MFRPIFKSWKTHGILILIGLAVCQSAPFEEDYDEQLLAPNSNCFSLVRGYEWANILNLDQDSGLLDVLLNATDSSIISCLLDQSNELPYVNYSFSLWRDSEHGKSKFEEQLFSVDEMFSQKNESRLKNLKFSFLLLKGDYQLQVKACNISNHDCDDSNLVTSSIIEVPENSRLVSPDSWCFGHSPNSEPIHRDLVMLAPDRFLMRYTYRPCFQDEIAGESALVTLYSMPEQNLEKNITGCFDHTSGADIFMKFTTRVHHTWEMNASHPIAVISFETPELLSGFGYCVTITSFHLACRDIDNFRRSINATDEISTNDLRIFEDVTVTEASDASHRIRHSHNKNANHPSFCHFHSELILISNHLPWLSKYLPMCTDHFACGWVYLTSGGVIILTMSCIIALICVNCCCKTKPSHYKTHQHVPTNDQHTFDTLCLADIKPKRTWLEIHEEFYKEPPKNPGKILLLYSPDSKLFNDLQQQFKSFLEEACHCMVLDLFDDDLLQDIAYNPEAWFYNLLKDVKFKILIICSQNAFKRQQALKQGEVLNIQNVNTGLEGLFTEGLKFIQKHHAYDYNRLAMVRYEMLASTGPEFKLQDMVPNREFLVPTQLHDLFCWIHGHDPLDLLGQPWSRYQLELQLLQDALKKARLERRASASAM